MTGELAMAFVIKEKRTFKISGHAVKCIWMVKDKCIDGAHRLIPILKLGPGSDSYKLLTTIVAKQVKVFSGVFPLQRESTELNEFGLDAEIFCFIVIPCLYDAVILCATVPKFMIINLLEVLTGIADCNPAATRQPGVRQREGGCPDAGPCAFPDARPDASSCASRCIHWQLRPDASKWPSRWPSRCARTWYLGTRIAVQMAQMHIRPFPSGVLPWLQGADAKEAAGPPRPGEKKSKLRAWGRADAQPERAGEWQFRDQLGSAFNHRSRKRQGLGCLK